MACLKKTVSIYNITQCNIEITFNISGVPVLVFKNPHNYNDTYMIAPQDNYNPIQNLQNILMGGHFYIGEENEFSKIKNEPFNKNNFSYGEYIYNGETDFNGGLINLSINGGNVAQLEYYNVIDAGNTTQISYPLYLMSENNYKNLAVLNMYQNTGVAAIEQYMIQDLIIDITTPTTSNGTVFLKINTGGSEGFVVQNPEYEYYNINGNNAELYFRCYVNIHNPYFILNAY